MRAAADLGWRVEERVRAGHLCVCVSVCVCKRCVLGKLAAAASSSRSRGMAADQSDSVWPAHTHTRTQIYKYH